MKMALEALEYYRSGEDYQPTPASKAITAIKAALKELGQEPLSDDEIKRIDDGTMFHESSDWSLRFARAIEQAHGIS